MTLRAREVLTNAHIVVGYKLYINLIRHILRPDAEVVDNGMRRERERIAMAVERAGGPTPAEVVVVSSGDAGIYGMAPLTLEMLAERGLDTRIDVEVVPGISAFQKAASLLGAPVGHDFCVISLSDLMTSWATIERRILAAAEADFVTAIYNPRSSDRYWQLPRLKDIFLTARRPSTPVGIVRQAGREGEEVITTTLADLDPESVDMLSVVIIGNERSFLRNGRFITPRGYYPPEKGSGETHGKGQGIMIESFRTIASELATPDIPLWRKWPLLHAIHTTADFDMEQLLIVSPEAPAKIYDRIAAGEVRTIITDVTMAASGIRKGALERLGLEVKCYLTDPRAVELARAEGLTRSEAGIRIAAADHPDALFVVGNAPTALMELCRLTRRGKAHPAGIIAAPVGFVHVCESKHMVKPLKDTPYIIVEGRKGGSNLAATLTNSILCWPDAADLLPGRDV